MVRIALSLSLLLMLACGGDAGENEANDLEVADAGAVEDGEAVVCVDRDGDGFGTGCELGLDCNDDDATRWDDCPACMRPQRGCECEAGTEPVECNMTPADVHEGNPLCKTGQRYCRDGVWTECIGIASF